MKSLSVEIWDVLCIFCFGLMHGLVGLRYAWPITAVAVGISSIEQDMKIHEVAAAAYMLRHACGAAKVTLGPTILITIYSFLLALSAHTSKYLALHYSYRRSVVLCALATSTLLLHGVTDASWFSVLRLIVFVAATRYDVAVNALDPWDSTAQKVWLLIIPWQAFAACPVYFFCQQPPKKPLRVRKDAFYQPGLEQV